jgi:general L-amino acid transport system permease protein
MAVQEMRGGPPQTRLSMNDPRLRAIAYQVVLLLCVGFGIWYLAHNAATNMARQGIAAGFGFLDREAAFAIAETKIPYSPSDTYARAFLVGLLNTLYVSAIGVVLATILGTLVGIARLSSNWLVRKLALAYVELFRNVPLLLQLFFWWALFREVAPGPRQAWHVLPGVFMSNRGLIFPLPADHPAHLWMLVALVAGIVGAVAFSKYADRRQMATGDRPPSGLVGTALVIGLPLLVWLAEGAPHAMDWPELKGFNFVGGHAITPEFTALLVGLVIYTASFIAEIVRGGILAVSWGQSEAAMALGLRRGWVLRLVVLPQALRVIIPPMTSQYLNLTKNSSLAVAIGYPDFVSIANTALNQTGQAVEGVALIMAAYLTVSPTISLFMNIYNRSVALVER